MGNMYATKNKNKKKKKKVKGKEMEAPEGCIDLTISNCLPVQYFVIPQMYQGDVSQVLIPHGLIMDRIDKLAQDILADTTQPLLCLCVLKGGFQFFTDLMSAMKRIVSATSKNIPLNAEFVRTQSYVNDKSTGTVQISGIDLNTLTGKVFFFCFCFFFTLAAVSWGSTLSASF